MDVESTLLSILDKISDLKSDISSLNTKLDTYNDYMDKTELAYSMSVQNQKDIEDIKANNKWLWRTLVGAVITILTGLVVIKYGS